MKTRLIAVMFAAVMTIGLTACSQNKENTSEYISEDEVKEKVLAHAEADIADALFTRLKLKTEEGQEIYEVEFYYDDREYDYGVDAKTGEILKFENEMEGRTAEHAVGDIGEEEARKLILKKAEGASEADIVIRRNTNDGEPIYEGTITSFDNVQQTAK